MYGLHANFGFQLANTKLANIARCISQLLSADSYSCTHHSRKAPLSAALQAVLEIIPSVKPLTIVVCNCGHLYSTSALHHWLLLLTQMRQDNAALLAFQAWLSAEVTLLKRVVTEIQRSVLRVLALVRSGLPLAGEDVQLADAIYTDRVPQRWEDALDPCKVRRFVCELLWFLL